MAQRLGLGIDGSTLLRQVRRLVQPLPVSGPRVPGVDDWAWKKGHQYGTILCNLESGTIVDLLPDREAGTLTTWLQEHSGTKIVSRDPSAYAKATRRACPEAIRGVHDTSTPTHAGGSLATELLRTHALAVYAKRLSI